MDAAATKITLELTSESATWPDTQMAGTALSEKLGESFRYEDMSGSSHTLGEHFEVTRCKVEAISQDAIPS